MENPKRKVVPGTEIYFRGDLRLNEEALGRELAIPPMPPFDELTLLYRDRLFHLTEDPPTRDSLTLCRHSFAVTEIESIDQAEQRFRQAHAAALAKGQQNFLRTLDPSLLDAAGQPVRGGYQHHLAAVALERLAPSARLSEYDRSLFLDGRRYGLLTVREFFELWRRGFSAELVEKVLDDPRTWRAKELSDFLQKRGDQANPNALSVLRSRLHNRRRPMHLFLDGQDWVPEPRGTTASFLRDWKRLIGHDLKRRALEPFL